MGMPHSRVEMLESNLSALSARVPGLPVEGVLLCRLMLHLGRETAATLHQQIRPFGLAEPEFRVLMTLFTQIDGIGHPTELCAGAAQSPANMSRICDALVARSLITRVASEQDRRRMVLAITAAGENLVQKLIPSLFEPLTAICAEFSAPERHMLINLLKRLAHRMEDVAQAKCR